MAHLLACVVCGYEMANDADCCPHCGTKEKPKRPHCNNCDNERKVYYIYKLVRRKKFFGWTEWQGWTTFGPMSRKQKDRENFSGEIAGEIAYSTEHQVKIGNIREEICRTCSRFYEKK